MGNAFFYLIDRLRRAMGAKKPLERLFMQALDNRTLGPREGDVQGKTIKRYYANKKSHHG